MIRRTLANPVVVSLAALALVACQDTESPLAPVPRVVAPRLSIDPAAQLDQQNLETNTHAAATAHAYGQSFTAGVSGQLTTISVLVSCKRGVVPDGAIEVYKGKYDVSNVHLAPPPIASQPAPASIWPTPCTFPETDVWLDFTFDAPAAMVAGQVYTFRLATPTADAAIVHPMHDSDVYAGGSAFAYSGFDIVFKTYVVPPTPQLDQQNLETNGHGAVTTNFYGQSFTAGVSGQLTTISVLVSCKRGPVPDGTLEVYNGKYDMANIHLAPPAIASRPVPASVWPTPCTFPETDAWLDFTFDTPASIVAGQVYTFRFATPTADAAIVHAMHSSDVYAGGSAFAYSGFDIVFKTFVLADAEPTDATPPVITPVVAGTLGENGWYTTNVNVTWSVVDAESAISASTGCGPSSVTADNTGVTFTCSATSAGGDASRSVTIRRDANGPTLDAFVSPDPVLLNGSASASHGASDGFSGLASATCGAVVTSSVGPKSAACTATDNAGNVTMGNASYSVVWPFTGFLGGVSPAPAMNSTKAGTTVQLKFNLGGNRGLAILAAGSPSSQTMNCSGKPLTSGDPVTASGTGLTYDAKSGQYLFSWKTEKAWATSCRKLILKLVDGSEHVAYFTFTK